MDNLMDNNMENIFNNQTPYSTPQPPQPNQPNQSFAAPQMSQAGIQFKTALAQAQKDPNSEFATELHLGIGL